MNGDINKTKNIRYPSILDTVHETAQGLHDARVISAVREKEERVNLYGWVCSCGCNYKILGGEMKRETTNPKDLEGDKKSKLSLVPPSVQIHLANAFEEGARKYGAYNWRTKKVQAMIYLDATLRHVLAVIDGEDIDPESGKHHLDGALASLAIYIDAMETGSLIDNRPPKGVAGQLIRNKKK